MKLTPIANNQNVVSYPDGTEVFFSYSTPVAGYHPDLGYVRTKEWYSSTTTRHINKYLAANNNNLDNHFTSVSQDVINNLAEGNGYLKEYTELEKELTTLEELSNEDDDEPIKLYANYSKEERQAIIDSDWGKKHLVFVNPERSMTDSRYALS